jgi:hypothetical protein
LAKQTEFAFCIPKETKGLIYLTKELEPFEVLNGYIKKYTEDDFKESECFLFAFKEFIKHCEKTSKQKILEQIKKTWQKLCEKFGNDKINRAIEEYSKKIKG